MKRPYETIPHLAVWVGGVCICIHRIQRVPGQRSKAIVFVAPIEGVIDPGLAPFVERVLNEATAADAKAVIGEY